MLFTKLHNDDRDFFLVAIGELALRPRPTATPGVADFIFWDVSLLINGDDERSSPERLYTFKTSAVENAGVTISISPGDTVGGS